MVGVPNNESSEREILQASLGPSADCPPLDELLREAGTGAPAGESVVSLHLKSCTYCQSELSLWQSFENPGPSGADVRKVISRLGEKMAARLVRRRPEGQAGSGWRRWFTLQWSTPAWLATAACLLLVTGVVLELRNSGHHSDLGDVSPSPAILRSFDIAVVSPSGDVSERPREIRWELVRGATKYEVSLLEVDRTEIWRTSGTSDRVSLPPEVQARVVPTKTLLCEIQAFDAFGTKLGDSGPVRFRLIGKPIKH